MFDLKVNPNRSVQRYKAKLVAKGSHKKPKIDFKETFSLTIKASTIQVVLIMVISINGDIVNNVFLNDNLQEVRYMA